MQARWGGARIAYVGPMEPGQFYVAQANMQTNQTLHDDLPLGDYNHDGTVNQADIDGWEAYQGKGPSRYDINLDAETNKADLKIIRANLGLDCLGLCARADLNRNGRVGDKDVKLLASDIAAGTCDDVLCNGDLNGDGKVNGADMTLMLQAKDSCGTASAEQ